MGRVLEEAARHVRRYVLAAAYSNLHPAQLPNTLIFGVPLIIDRDPEDEPNSVPASTRNQ